MNLLTHFLVATLLIAGFILLRMYADRCALRTKIRRDHTDTGCEQAGCFRGCDADEITQNSESVSRKAI